MYSKNKADPKEKAFEKVLITTFRGGRRRAAVLLDTAATGILIFLALYLLALSKLRNGVIAFAAALLAFSGACAIIMIVRRERFSSHRERLLCEARRQARRLDMMLAPEKVFERIEVSEGEYLHRSTDRLSSDDVAAAVKTAGLPLTIITFAEPTDAAAELIKLSCGRIRLVSPEERLGQELPELFPVTDEEAKKTTVAMHGGCLKKASLKKGVIALTKERAVKYAAVGAGLYAMSFIVRYALYYRIIACIAMSIGAWVFAAERLAKIRTGTGAG